MTLPSDLVSAMYADYQRGCALAALARAYGRDRGSLRRMFQRRGLAVRPHLAPNRHLPNGCWAPYTPATPAQIDAMIAGLSRVMIPDGLRIEWRHWPMSKRAEFIALVRCKLNFPNDRPRTPFSANVRPFDYTTPRAWEIARAANSALDSHTARVKLKLASQGVIWRGKLFFWSRQGDGYYPGPYKPGIGRLSLHHLIWERHNRRPVPPHYTVIFRDANKNNLSPGNLTLRSRADCAGQNSRAGRLKRSRAAVAALLRAQQRNTHEHTRTLNTLLQPRQPASRA
jgi:hypothetical protein